MLIIFLFVNENIKYGNAFYFLSLFMTNILVPKLFGFAKTIVYAFSATPFSMGETLHIAYKKYKINYKKYKIKRILLFFQ